MDCLDEVRRWVLSWEDHAPVIRPAALAVARKNRTHGTSAYPHKPVEPASGPMRWPITPEMTTVPVTGADGRAAVALGVAARRSHEEKRPVRMAEIG